MTDATLGLVRTGQIGAARHANRDEDARQVALDRLLAHHEAHRDFAIGESSGDKIDHL